MSSNPTILGISIPQSDWEATPSSVKTVVKVLEERLSHVEEQNKQNSQNSSRPPSSDGLKKPKGFKAKAKPKSRKAKDQGTSKEDGHSPQLYPLESCAQVHSCIPQVCKHCGEELSGTDPHPHRHQIVDIPPLSAYVEEYQQHRLACDCCGKTTVGELPLGVPRGHYGDRLAGVVSWLRGDHRQSHQLVKSLLQTLLDIEISQGSINRLCTQVSEALAEPVEAAHAYVQSHAYGHSDETGFAQGNGDGKNPTKRRGWLWVLATPLVVFFSIALSRSQATAKALIGEHFQGIVISDRCKSYSWLELEHRQLCWAHLKRDFQAIAERTGVSRGIGRRLLRYEGLLFGWWYQVRDGTLSREDFIQKVKPLREKFRQHLEATAALPISKGETTPLAKTVRMAQELLPLEPALWTFVEHEGIEPTNNRAEQALRPAVILRKLSFGSQSQKGSEFVSRILTVLTSLKAQGRDPVEFLAQACRAKRLGIAAPSLLPHTEAGC